MIEPDASESPSSFERRLPLVLRPNRGPNFTWALIFLGILGFAIFNLIISDGSSFTYEIDLYPNTAPRMERGMGWLGMALFVGLSLFIIRREFTLFRPGGSYFVELSAEGVTVSSPFKRRHFAWSEVERFRVGATRVGDNAGSKKTYTIRADLREGGLFKSGVAIAQGDFAEDLGSDRAASAEILCGFLNEVRDRVREAEFAGRPAIVPVPYGLHVAEVAGAGAMGEAPPRAKREFGKRSLGGAKPANRTPTVTRE